MEVKIDTGLARSVLSYIEVIEKSRQREMGLREVGDGMDDRLMPAAYHELKDIIEEGRESAPNSSPDVFGEIRAEMERQVEKWGVQNHPSVDPVLSDRDASAARMCDEYEMPTDNRAKQLCETAASRGCVTWSHIAVEELSEAISAKNEADRRAELVQLAAVVASWIESIDRNSGQ